MFQNNPQPQKHFLSAGEAASFLHISASKLYKLTMNKEIPFYCPFGKKSMLFDPDELFDWVKGFKKETVAETESEAINLFKKHNKHGK